LQPVFPDLLRRVIATTGLELIDYRIDQIGDQWEFRIRTSQNAVCVALAEALIETCRRHEWCPPRLEARPWIEAAFDEKRRRIRCVSRPEGSVACAS
jgi:hypothetical protein